LFLEYCKGNGLDIGYGGSPINNTAICFDLPKDKRYSWVGESPQHIEGSAEDLSIFADNALDYAFSSHLIEDFTDTYEILKEWTRIIKIGGYLCLLFPDQQRYEKISKTINTAHKYKDFGLQFVLDIIDEVNHEFYHMYELKIIEAKELFDNDDYNCMIIAQKVKQI
jgi:ubiquinone/menaquinone biosynthesis C-methylase UbiE